MWLPVRFDESSDTFRAIPRLVNEVWVNDDTAYGLLVDMLSVAEQPVVWNNARSYREGRRFVNLG